MIPHFKRQGSIKQPRLTWNSHNPPASDSLVQGLQAGPQNSTLFLLIFFPTDYEAVGWKLHFNFFVYSCFSTLEDILHCFQACMETAITTFTCMVPSIPRNYWTDFLLLFVFLNNVTVACNCTIWNSFTVICNCTVISSFFICMRFV